MIQMNINLLDIYTYTQIYWIHTYIYTSAFDILTCEKYFCLKNIYQNN